MVHRTHQVKETENGIFILNNNNDNNNNNNNNYPSDKDSCNKKCGEQFILYNNTFDDISK